MSKDTKTFTYETRITVCDETLSILDAFGKLYGVMERTLFHDLSLKKESVNELKRRYNTQFGVTARHFNGCYRLLLGKIESVKQLRLLEIERCKERVALLKKKISHMKNPSILHQKKRSLHTTESRLETLEKESDVSLCFGGKKLFRAQFYLKENEYNSHEEWKKDWEAARSSEFFCIGSKDESAGNQSCVLTEDEKGFLARLRLPNSFIQEHGKYIAIPLVFPAHATKEILKALRNDQALSYRFKKDKKGWRVFVSFDQTRAPIETKDHIGAIGIDINVNHIALTEIDVHGNPIHKKTYPLSCYGKRTAQSKALIGDVVKEIVQYAKEKQKPIVCEELNFKKKKVALKEDVNWRARMLSSFHYSAFLEFLDRKTFREGVVLHTVNPAMTSIIGRIKFAVRYGLSGHHSAALVIARRHFHFSEAPAKCMRAIHKRFHVTIELPVWNRSVHVWKRWKIIMGKWTTALAAPSQASPSQQQCIVG